MLVYKFECGFLIRNDRLIECKLWFGFTTCTLPGHTHGYATNILIDHDDSPSRTIVDDGHGFLPSFWSAAATASPKPLELLSLVSKDRARSNERSVAVWPDQFRAQDHDS